MQWLSARKCIKITIKLKFSNYNSHLKLHVISWNLHHNKVLQQPVWNYVKTISQNPLICSMKQVIDCCVCVLCFKIVINNLPSPSWYKDSDEEDSFTDGSANSCSSNPTIGDTKADQNNNRNQNEVTNCKHWHVYKMNH